jgi:alpha-beta hydrolase superfamily lysophospholipase
MESDHNELSKPLASKAHNDGTSNAVLRATPAEDRAKYFVDGGVEGPMFKNAEGVEIVTKRFLPHDEKEDPKTLKALVFYVHGYGDHAHAPFLTRFGNALVKRNMGFFLCDLPGCGLSGGIRFDIIPEQAMNTFEQFMELTMKEFPGIPYFLMGESLGGAYSILLSIKHTNKPGFKGAFHICPAIHNDVEPPACVSWLGKLCCLPCCPLARVPAFLVPPLSPELISDKKEIQEEIAADDLVDDLPFRLRSAQGLLDTTHEIQERYKEVKYPFLILHGDNDHIIPLSGSQALFEQCSTAPDKKRLIAIPNSGHAVIQEIEGTETYDVELFKWFEQAL